MVEVLGPEVLVVGASIDQCPAYVVLRVGSRETRLNPAAARCVGRMLLEAADMAGRAVVPGFKIQLSVNGTDDE
jgi:hypothetical protein